MPVPVDDDRTTEELVELIRCTGPKRVDPNILIPLFSHAHPDVVLEACQAAARMADPRIVQYVAPCLVHESTRVRYGALDAILKSECRRLIPDVQAAQKTETHPLNRQLCQKIVRLQNTADIRKLMGLYQR